MSRAFVDDDAADSSLDEAPEIKIPIPVGSRNYLTPEGAARLADELRSLELSERPRIASELERASKAQADADALSALRASLAKVDRRIEYLARMAALAETVEAPQGKRDRVTFGALVTLREGPGGPKSYRIVGVDEADPAAGRIAWTSPIAKALIGKRAGDLARATLPEREIVIEVLSVE